MVGISGHGVKVGLKLKLCAIRWVLPVMNLKKLILVVALAGGLFSATVASAVTISLVDQTAEAVVLAPQPVKVVMPTGLLARYEGATVMLKMTIDEVGRPQDVSLVSDRSMNLIQNLLPAVKRWEFSPATRDGQAVPMEVILPVKLVDIPTA
jgi:TonB family protein